MTEGEVLGGDGTDGGGDRPDSGIQDLAHEVLGIIANEGGGDAGTAGGGDGKQTEDYWMAKLEE